MTPAIVAFNGPYRFLSNFSPDPVQFLGVTYPTAEHAFQAAKATTDEDRNRVYLQPTPRRAKRMGSRIQLRPDWEAVKLDVMHDVVYAKFTQHPELAVALIATGDAQLIEGNTWGDAFWGVCGGRGENHLGKILMHVRAQLLGDSNA